MLKFAPDKGLPIIMLEHQNHLTPAVYVGSAYLYDTVVLTRIIHEPITAAADTGMSTALRSVGFLDVPSSAPAESSRRAG